MGVYVDWERPVFSLSAPRRILWDRLADEQANIC